jgi:hypothetical protein
VVGLTTAPERLIQVRRNRLLSLNQGTDTAYVDNERVSDELLYARRMFADNGWPVIDVTRRSIEETAAAVINLLKERRAPKKPNWTPNEPDPCQQERIAPGNAGCRRRGASGDPRAGGRARDRGRHGGRRPADVALALAGAKALAFGAAAGAAGAGQRSLVVVEAAVSTSPPRAPMPPIICASFPGARCSCIPPPRLPAMGRWCGARRMWRGCGCGCCPKPLSSAIWRLNGPKWRAVWGVSHRGAGRAPVPQH